MRGSNDLRSVNTYVYWNDKIDIFLFSYNFCYKNQYYNIIKLLEVYIILLLSMKILVSQFSFRCRIEVFKSLSHQWASPKRPTGLPWWGGPVHSIKCLSNIAILSRHWIHFQRKRVSSTPSYQLRPWVKMNKLLLYQQISIAILADQLTSLITHDTSFWVILYYH